jgi:hypothetical protein
MTEQRHDRLRAPMNVGPRSAHRDLHCHPRYSQPTLSSWRKFQRAMLAGWDRIKQRTQRGSYPKNTQQ